MWLQVHAYARVQGIPEETYLRNRHTYTYLASYRYVLSTTCICLDVGRYSGTLEV